MYSHHMKVMKLMMMNVTMVTTMVGSLTSEAGVSMWWYNYLYWELESLCHYICKIFKSKGKYIIIAFFSIWNPFSFVCCIQHVFSFWSKNENIHNVLFRWKKNTWDFMREIFRNVICDIYIHESMEIVELFRINCAITIRPFRYHDTWRLLS